MSLFVDRECDVEHGTAAERTSIPMALAAIRLRVFFFSTHLSLMTSSADRTSRRVGIDRGRLCELWTGQYAQLNGGVLLSSMNGFQIRRLTWVENALDFPGLEIFQ